MRWLIAVSLILGLATSLPGCGFESSDDSAPRGVCQADGDCPGDQVCRANFCSVPSANLSGLNFQFLPTNSSSLQPQTALGVSTQNNQALNFQLESSILVEGRVTYDASDTGPSGTLVFKARNGTTRRVDVNPNEAYQVWLRRGVYDVTFLPNDPESTQSRTRFEESFMEGDRRRYDFDLVPPDDLIQVRGRLVHSSQVAGCELPSGKEAPENALPGARIYAASENEQYRSTVAISDAEGRFVLDVPRNTGVYNLNVDAADSECIVPTMIDRGAIDSSETEVTTVQVNVGPVPQFRIDLSEISVRPPDDIPSPDNWSDFTVELRAPLGRGSFRTQARLSEDGRLPMSLPPATYTAHFIPPNDSPIAPTTRELIVGDALPQEGLQLETRRQIQGTVVDPDGNPVSDAQVRMRPVEPPPGGDADPLTRRTDQAGEFTAWLNPTDYTGVVRPKSASGLPSSTFSIDVERTAITIDLPDPFVATGSVLQSSDGELVGVPNLTVEVRRETGPHLWTLDQAQTNRDGYFSVLLPARFE